MKNNAEMRRVVAATTLGLSAIFSGGAAEEGLVGRWEMEEGSGAIVKDSSGQGHHGQLAGGEWTQGVVGCGAISLASKGRIEIPHDPALKPAAAITVALWVRGSKSWFSGYGQGVFIAKTADGGGAISLGAWRGMINCHFTTRGVKGGPRTGSVEPQAEPVGDVTEWHHHAVTYDGAVARLYADGSLQGAREFGGAIAYGDQPIEVGSEDLGDVDDLRIYNRALSQAEIARLAAMGGRSELARDEAWLRKARAMADTLTATQHPAGYYPTWMDTGTFRPSKDQPFELREINYGDIWPNCSAEPAAALLRLGEYGLAPSDRKEN